MFDPRDDGRDRDGREDRRARVYGERDRDDDDPREGLMRDLDLPRGEERELVALRDRVYELDGEDSRTLAAVGAFRVVPEHDLDIDHDTLDHLRDQGLVEAVELGDDERGLTLTREGRDLLFVTFGPITARAMAVADVLEARGWSVGVVNARFAKPLDRQLILDAARGKSLLVTFEESVVTGGFGSGVLEAVEEARLTDPALRALAVKLIGIPGDRFVDHGSVTDLRRLIRIDVPGLQAQVEEAIEQLGIEAPTPAG